jgi:hypothetical protein
MRRVSILLTFVLAGFFGRFTLADDKPSSPHYEKYRILETWIGDWTNAGTFDGVDYKGRFSCNWAPGRSCLIWTWEIDGKAPELLEAKGYGIMGWDPNEGKIKEMAYGEKGLTYTTLFEVKGNDLHGTRTTILPNGDKFTETMVFTSSKDRIAIKNLERRDAAGKIVPLLFPKHGEFLRVQRGSTVDAKRSATPAGGKHSSREDFREFCQALQGRWIGEVTWVTDWPGIGKRGEKVTCYFEGRIAEDGHAIAGRWYGGAGSGTGVYYFDPRAKQIRWFWVNSGGALEEGILYKSNGHWVEEGSGSLEDGRATAHASDLTITDKGNTHTYTGKGTVGGTKTDDRHDVWRRVGK